MSRNSTYSSSSEQTDEITQGLTHSSLNGFFWISLGTGVQAVLELLVLVVLARLLTPKDFGVVSAALVMVGFTSIFSWFGIGWALVQRSVLETRHVRTAFTLSLLFSTAATGLIWLFAPSISGFFPIEGLTPVVRVMSLIFLLQNASIVAQSLLQRDLRFRLLSTIQVTALAVGFGAVGITLALIGFGVWALVGAHLAKEFLKTTILLVVQPHPKRPLIEGYAFNELMVFSVGSTVTSVGNYLAVYSDSLVVGRWLGAEALGLYARACQLMMAPAMVLGQVLDNVLFPIMAKVQDYPERLAIAYRRGVALIAIVILPTSTAFFILAPELIDVLLGPKWHKAIMPFQILVAGMLFRCSYKISDTITRASGAVYRSAWRQGIYALLMIGGAFGGQHWGLPGVAFGVVSALAIHFILMAHLSLGLANMTWQSFWAAHIPGLMLTAVLGPEVWAFATLLRYWGYSSILVLMISAAVLLLTTFVLLRHIPQLFLGQDGLWILQALTANLPIRINRSRRLGQIPDH